MRGGWTSAVVETLETTQTLIIAQVASFQYILDVFKICRSQILKTFHSHVVFLVYPVMQPGSFGRDPSFARDFGGGSAETGGIPSIGQNLHGISSQRSACSDSPFSQKFGRGQEWESVVVMTREVILSIENNFSYSCYQGPKGNPQELPCHPKKNPDLPNSFTHIYIIFQQALYSNL